MYTAVHGLEHAHLQSETFLTGRWQLLWLNALHSTTNGSLF